MGYDRTLVIGEHKPMSRYLSRKLRLLSLFSIFVVVLCHVCDKVSLPYDGSAPYDASQWVAYFLKGSMARVNRPYFFMISGFLFFLGLKPTLDGFAKKWRKRGFSLGVPYLTVESFR